VIVQLFTFANVPTRLIFPRMGNIIDRIVKKIKTRTFGFNITFFENHAFYDIKWKNIVLRGRPQMAIWRTRIACWIPKVTHSEFVIFIVLLLKKWLHKRASLLQYTHIVFIKTEGICRVHYAVSLKVSESIPGGVTGDFFRGIRQFHVPGVDSAS
jgi:hypothetical protein